MTLIRITIVASMLALAGCKMNVETDLYSSDLRAVAEGAQDFTTPATLFLPVTSEDQCAEETAKIVAIMQGIVEPFQPKGCEQQGMNSYMLADLQLPILDSMGAWEQADALFGIISQHRENSPNASVFVMMDLHAYQTLNGRVKDEFYQSLDLKESTFTVVLNNDERNDMSVVFDHAAFVNGQPVLETILTAPRREQITVKLSNVSVQFLGEHGAVPVFTLLGEKQN